MIGGSDGSGLSEDGPIWATDLRAAPPTFVLWQSARKKREHLARAGPLRQQADTLTSQTPSSGGKVAFWADLKSVFCKMCLFQLYFSPSSICHSWPAAASFQLWTIRGTTTCASSTTTSPTSKLHESAYRNIFSNLKIIIIIIIRKKLRKWSTTRQHLGF